MNRVAIRIIGAPLILAALALIVYLDHRFQTTRAVTALIGLFALISYHELCAMARLKGMKPAEGVGLGALVAAFAVALGWTGLTLPIVFVLQTLVVLALLVFRSPAFSPPDAGFGLLAFLYVSLLLSIPLPPHWADNWNHWLLFLLATNKGSDMAAYTVGKSLGRHKLAPTISPNKTWEGSLAGLLVGSVLGYFVLKSWGTAVPVHNTFSESVLIRRSDLILLGAAAAVTVAAQLGDLVKSVIKRWAGVKDSGRLLPEFGGALDMVDSFILSAPVAAWLIFGRS